MKDIYINYEHLLKDCLPEQSFNILKEFEDHCKINNIEIAETYQFTLNSFKTNGGINYTHVSTLEDFLVFCKQNLGDDFFIEFLPLNSDILCTKTVLTISKEDLRDIFQDFLLYKEEQSLINYRECLEKSEKYSIPTVENIIDKVINAFRIYDYYVYEKMNY